jgi:hypothetical protein
VSLRRVQQQVRSILDANSLPWTESANGDLYLRFASASVAIEFAKWGEQTLIEISSHVVTNVEGGTKRILVSINELNKTSNFGRWIYFIETRTISVEYDLLGDHLQENELMTGLAALARLADRHDDLLKQEFGGTRAFED